MPSPLMLFNVATGYPDIREGMFAGAAASHEQWRDMHLEGGQQKHCTMLWGNDHISYALDFTKIPPDNLG